MKKEVLYILFLGSALLFISCDKLKERDIKDLEVADKKLSSTGESVILAAKNPSIDNLINAGDKLVSAKQPAHALIFFERALKIAPKNNLVLNNICAAYNDLGKWDKSIPYCQQSIAISPHFQLAQNNLKYAQDRKADQLKLIAGLNSQVQESSGVSQHELLLSLGLEFYKMDNFEAAISVWKKIPASNDALYVRALSNLGSAYIILKKFDLAKSALEEAVKLDPNDDYVKNNLAWFKKESANVSR